MKVQYWKVGEVASRTGLTIRTLHHYDAIGLLSPSGRTESAHGSGHRQYTTADLVRLHQIICLKQLGFSLEQVKDYLTSTDYDPREVVRLHLAKVRVQAAKLAELGDRLAALAATLDSADMVSAETFLETIEVMTMIEKYYTPEQLEQLQQRKTEVGEARIGEARIGEVQDEWPRLMAEVQAAMDAGIEPSDPKALILAKRWVGLVNEFTGSDPGIFKSLKNMYQSEESVRGMDVKSMQPMMEYVGKVMQAAGLKFGGE